MNYQLRLFLVACGVVLTGFAGAGQIKEYKPVTNAESLNPDPGDWIHWRRTPDGQAFSPLTQINKQNVHTLQLVWSWASHDGMTEATPHVRGGIMFLPQASGGVQALDAVTGDLLWDYHLGLAKADIGEGSGNTRVTGLGNAAGLSRPMRNLAFWGDKVYTATSIHQGGKLVALDAKTGKVVWEQPVGYGHSAGPIAADGKIVLGTTNCQEFSKADPPCFIAALDAETGKEIWKTSTIQRPGEGGPDSWSGIPLMFRRGGENWGAGSYDPKTRLVYFGTAQAKPWIPYQRHTDGTALYTSSTLALDIDTGKIAWYYQAIPGEAYDMDETFERILIDYDGKSSVFEMGKIGILWEMDRRTGQYRSAHDLGYQDQGHIDPKTGQLVYDRLPQQGVPISFCPGVSGFKNWRAMAYYPKTYAVFIPLQLWCTTGVPAPPIEQKEGGGGTGGFRNSKSSFHPTRPDGTGEFAAMDIRNGKILWSHKTRTPPTTSAMTTAGGLVVVGNFNRNTYFYEAETGKILYQVRLPGPPVGSPTTYMVNGRQYVAIPLGTGSMGGWMRTPPGLMPDIRAQSQRWEFFPNGVHVFALPQPPRK